MDTLTLTAIVALVGAITAGAVSLYTARSASKKSDVERLEKGFSAVQASLNSEIDRLNTRMVKQQNDYDALYNKQNTDRAECQRQLIILSDQNLEQERQLTLLIAQGKDMVRKVVIVGADIPVDEEGKPISPIPALIVGPLPLPTAAQTEAAKKIISEAADTAKDVLAEAAVVAKEKE